MTTRDDIRMSGGLQDERHERGDCLVEASKNLLAARRFLLRAVGAGWRDKGGDLLAIEDAIGALNADIEKLADELEAEKLERP